MHKFNDNSDVTFIKEYDFTNITGADSIIHKFENHDFKNQNFLIKTAHINDKSDYDKAHTLKNPFERSHLGYVFGNKFIEGKSLDSLFKKFKDMNGSLVYNVVFNKTLNFKTHDIENQKSWILEDLCFDLVNIDGHGSKIYADADDRSGFKLAVVPENKILCLNNLTIQSFNIGIENRGYCFFNNVNFKDNCMDYIMDRDWGAAILNCGYCQCNNCSFINNRAEYGGAIFNLGLLLINGSVFSGNHAEETENGDNICNIKGGNVYINGEKITSGLVKCRNELPDPVPTWVKILTVSVGLVVGGLGGAGFGFAVAGAPLGLVIGLIGGAVFGVAAALFLLYMPDDIQATNPSSNNNASVVYIGQYFSKGASDNMEQYHFVC